MHIVKINETRVKSVKYGILHAYDHKCIKRATELNNKDEMTPDEKHHYDRENEYKPWGWV